MRKIPEKVQWAKKILSKHARSLRVLSQEGDLNYLKNKYQVKRGGKTVSVLNPGFKFVIHLVSQKNHKEDDKSKEILAHWEGQGYKVFFLEAFSDEDFFKIRKKIKNYKRSRVSSIKNYLKDLQKRD